MKLITSLVAVFGTSIIRAPERAFHSAVFLRSSAGGPHTGHPRGAGASGSGPARRTRAAGRSRPPAHCRSAAFPRRRRTARWLPPGRRRTARTRFPPRRRPKVPLPVEGRTSLDVLSPVAVLRRVVGHPVENHVEAVAVRRLHEVLEVLHGAEVRVHRVVILDRVRTAQGALPVLLTDHLHRHQPEDHSTKGFEPREVILGRTEGALLGELQGVDPVSYT